MLSIQKQIIGLIGWLGICFVAAGLGSMPSIQAAAFYQELTRPDWAPPAWLFGPVWTVLYALMGVSAWLVWRRGGFQGARLPLKMFLLQLAINALWSWLFFGWYQGALAFVDILILWALILVTILGFWRVQALAGILLLPYLLWVSFAAVLNLSVWQLNPRLLGM